jgi:hypothetical protein
MYPAPSRPAAPIMFRMNGISQGAQGCAVRLFQSRTAHQLCGAIVSGRHTPQSNRDRLRRSLIPMHHPVGGASRGDYVQDKMEVERFQHSSTSADTMRLLEKSQNRQMSIK